MPYYRLSEVSTTSEFPGVTHRHSINKQTGATGVQLGEVVIDPGTAIPPHYHEVDDAMYVISGKGQFLEGETESPIEAGMTIVAPARVRHGLRNDGNEPLRIIFVWPTIEPVKRLGVEK